MSIELLKNDEHWNQTRNLQMTLAKIQIPIVNFNCVCSNACGQLIFSKI